MKIAVFGSTGPTGQLIVKYALSKGYQVVAYARNPSKIGFQHPDLTVIRGTLYDSAAIEKTVSGVDAVISMLGASSNVKTTELSKGMSNIIIAMQKHNVKRLVAMGTASVNEDNDRPELKFRLLVSIVKRLIPGAYNEIRRIGGLVKQSGLQWTLIRIGLLSNRPPTGNVTVGYYGRHKLKLRISRSDLARFFVDQILADQYLYKAPAVSN